MKSSLTQFLLDLRDFSYIHYSKTNSRVSAKNWYGYRLFFTMIFLAYYITLYVVVGRTMVQMGIDVHSDYVRAHSWNPLFRLAFGTVFFLPFIYGARLVLNKLDKIQPLYYKSAEIDIKRKNMRAWITMALGWILLLGSFILSNMLSGTFYDLFN